MTTKTLVCPEWHAVMPIKVPTDKDLNNWIQVQAYGEKAYICLDCGEGDGRPYWGYQCKEVEGE